MATEITEEWLREMGFKWEQGDRQPSKHWLLWIADCRLDPSGPRMMSSPDDLGIEVAKNDRGNWWFCWLRADYAGRYTRLLHVRHLVDQQELVTLIEALTGRPFVPADAMYGSLRDPESAQRLRDENERLDNRIAQRVMQSIDINKGNDTDKRGIA